MRGPDAKSWHKQDVCQLNYFNKLITKIFLKYSTLFYSLKKEIIKREKQANNCRYFSA